MQRVRYVRNTSGEYVAFVAGEHLFTPEAEWLGLLSGEELFDTEGEHIGTLWPDGRLVRNLASGPQRSTLRPPQPLRPVRPIPPMRGLFLPELVPPLGDVFEGLARRLTALTPTARLQEMFELEGAALVAHDGAFLGLVSRDRAGEESLGNPTGPYGSPASEDSIFNPGGRYGAVEGDLSPFDPGAATPPSLELEGEFAGHLSLNPEVPARVDPNALIAWLAIR